MTERATVTLGGERLPSEFRPLLTGPLAARRYRVTVEEIEETDEEKRVALRQTLTERFSEIDAGNVQDGQAALQEVYDRHFPKGA